MARIRTIKPEFWQNESLASVGEHARLLAIALLNHADDKGCFLASHHLVRAACFPFEEDSKNVLGSLKELSRIGYIEIRDCGGKQVGRICKFLDHQRIDKPQKSKLIGVFLDNPEGNCDSDSIPGTLQEASESNPRPERNGKEEEGKGMDNTHTHSQRQNQKLEIPPELAIPFSRWAEWIFATTGQAIPNIQAETLLMDLGRRGVDKATRDVDFSINKGAKSILDSDNDFQRRQSATATYSKPVRKRNYE
jgi:hypothetical protein